MTEKLSMDQSKYVQKYKQVDNFDDMMFIESSEFNIGEVQGVRFYPEDLESTNPKLLNYWLRNRLAYFIKNYVLRLDQLGMFQSIFVHYQNHNFKISFQK